MHAKQIDLVAIEVTLFVSLQEMAGNPLNVEIGQNSHKKEIDMLATVEREIDKVIDKKIPIRFRTIATIYKADAPCVPRLGTDRFRFHQRMDRSVLPRMEFEVMGKLFERDLDSHPYLQKVLIGGRPQFFVGHGRCYHGGISLILMG